jgi:hypothetical protein
MEVPAELTIAAQQSRRASRFELTPAMQPLEGLAGVGVQEILDCDASSITTRSNSPTSGGIASDIRQWGKTQHGTAEYLRYFRGLLQR